VARDQKDHEGFYKMKKLTAEDVETKSPDVVADNVEQLKALFPEAFTEGKVDFEVLKQLLGGAVEEREEKYGLNWHGKRRARQLALTPSTGTLRPCQEESVDWDTTRNLMIEGDNLEVLKLLQKSYSGKVKLIYIDPPYNTGKDFVYPDDFRDNIKNYLELTGQTDGEGRKISSNTEASGRFHTDWLNMMYPRLKLARNLLSEDGSIFVSIADHEIQNLRIIMDEVFGEENFIASVIWQKVYSPKNSARHFSEDHDYIVVYAKSAEIWTPKLLPRTKEMEARYNNPDNDSRGPWKAGDMSARNFYGEGTYLITCPSGRVISGPPSGTYWRYSKKNFEEMDRDNRIWWGTDGNNVPAIKRFLSEVKEGRVPQTLWTYDEVGHTQEAKKELLSLVDFANSGLVFDTPKPTRLMRRILQIATSASGTPLTAEDEDLDGETPNAARPIASSSSQSGSVTPEIVLDFFAGTGSTMDAVFRQNAEDGAPRKCILVQLPEPLSATEGAFRTIADVTKERLRRAGDKVREENPMFAGDLGFRVFKLASSNIRAWEPDREDLPTTLMDSIEHLKTDRTEQDILFELLLKLGLDLTIPIEQKTIAGKAVHNLGAGTLLVCLAEHITAAEVEPLALGMIAWHKELAPAGETTVVFRDSGFVDDVAKTNLTAILQQHGLDNVRSL
jgi:adenine-specific DNA-methyltransferase